VEETDVHGAWRRQLLLVLALELLLAVADVATSARVVPTTAYVLAPIALAFTGRPPQVAIAGAAAVALAIASGWWNDYAGSVDHLLRVLTVAAGSLLAVLGARVSAAAASEHARNARLVGDLRSAQARLDGILVGLAEAVVVHDEQANIVFANEAAATLLGYPSAAAASRAAPGEIPARFVLTREDGTPIVADELPGRRLIAGRPAPDVLAHAVQRDGGRVFWLLIKATPLEDDGHRYAVIVIEDVTQEKQAEERARFLAETGRALASSLDYERTLQRVAELAVPLLADWCTVDVPHRDGAVHRLALAYVDPAHAELADRVRDRTISRTGVDELIAGGEALLLPEVPEPLVAERVHDETLREVARALQIGSAMVLPMRIGDETVGVITMLTTHGRRYDAADFELAKELARRAALAVQNARLYETTSRVAHTLQATLLPARLPELPGWIAAAGYEAGEKEAEVGGDFYDIVAAEGGGHLVFLGDVTGKGIAAAALTALVRHSVRTAARFDSRPAAVLALVNDVLLEQERLSPVTLACLLIDGPRVRVAAGGHPLPLLRHGGEVREVGEHGLLLGAVEPYAAREVEIELTPGDALMLFTDGVTDTPGAVDRFGDERLAGIFAASGPEPRATVQSVDAALRLFQSGTTVDDRAVLVLRYVGERSSARLASRSAA